MFVLCSVTVVPLSDGGPPLIAFPTLHAPVGLRAPGACQICFGIGTRVPGQGRESAAVRPACSLAGLPFVHTPTFPRLPLSTTTATAADRAHTHICGVIKLPAVLIPISQVASLRRASFIDRVPTE